MNRLQDTRVIAQMKVAIVQSPFVAVEFWTLFVEVIDNGTNQFGRNR
jgi:hypothetical protein